MKTGKRYRPHSLLKLSQVAEVLGLEVRAVRHIVTEGRLTTFTLPGSARPERRVKYAEVLAFLRQIEESATNGSRREP
jgi:hypothetical protein